MTFAMWAEATFVGVLLVPFLFWLFCVLYLWRLLFSAFLWRKRLTALAPPNLDAPLPAVPTPSDAQTRFVLLMPAHNEGLILGRILEGAKCLNYPADAYRLLVIADNCDDNTAEIAQSAGVLVWERTNAEERGKGYALEWAINRLLHEDQTDPALAQFEAIVVLDADTVVAPNLLTEFAAEMERGGKVLQARYEVLNLEESWRTRLMGCALALVHLVKPLGRERLRLSEGLKGNGMAFAREVVERVPWSGASITEDIEYALRLCRAGYRVQFVPQTAVWAQMPVTAAQSRSQRERWEGGRYHLLTHTAPRLFMESLHKRDRVLQDRAIELFIPPFAEMFAIPVLLGALSLGCGLALSWAWAVRLAVAWGVLLVLEAGYLFLGLKIARVPWSVAKAVVGAPLYIVWKFGVYIKMALQRSAGGWKRTERREL